MSLPAELPVVDHHCHLSPTGEGVAAAARFQAEGGTHLFLATQNYASGPPLELEAYREQFETTRTLARRVEEETAVRVFVVLAPYPVDLLAQAERLGVPAALELQRAALDVAGRIVREQGAIALGEVGHPHFPYPENLREAVDLVLDHAFEVGRDVGCPVVLHGEELTEEGFAALSGQAARASFPVQRLVKHYHRTVLAADQYHGLVPSYLAKRELTEAALRTAGPWFLETDFLDDPKRPGAVLDLTTVPRRVRQALEKDPAMLERFRIPFEESVEAVYGFRPVPPPERAR